MGIPLRYDIPTLHGALEKDSLDSSFGEQALRLGNASRCTNNSIILILADTQEFQLLDMQREESCTHILSLEDSE